MSGNIDETNATAKRGVGFLPTEPDAIVGDLLLKKNQQMKQQQSDDETVMECCQLMLADVMELAELKTIAIGPPAKSLKITPATHQL